MATSAMFPQARAGAGMYESFYLRAVSPGEPVGVWIRHTVHKRPGHAPRGSVWCTVFDAAAETPFMHKLTTDRLEAPATGWIAVGDPGSDSATSPGAEGASLAPGVARGRCGAASWSLRWAPRAPELRHLPRELLYRTPLPRTKLTSPAPSATFDGVVEVAGRGSLQVSGWPGMVGHNWGSEHAARWIWLHGVGFGEQPDGWLDVALGRIEIAGRLTPWIANGALSLGGDRHRIGGLGARGVRVAETPEGCSLRLGGAHGLTVKAHAQVPAGSAAGWRYSDPDGSTHDVVNCSIAALQLSVTLPGTDAPRSLASAHGGAYELGMREHDHGVPIAPFADG